MNKKIALLFLFVLLMVDIALALVPYKNQTLIIDVYDGGNPQYTGPVSFYQNYIAYLTDYYKISLYDMDTMTNKSLITQYPNTGVRYLNLYDEGLIYIGSSMGSSGVKNYVFSLDQIFNIADGASHYFLDGKYIFANTRDLVFGLTAFPLKVNENNPQGIATNSSCRPVFTSPHQPNQISDSWVLVSEFSQPPGEYYSCKLCNIFSGEVKYLNWELGGRCSEIKGGYVRFNEDAHRDEVYSLMTDKYVPCSIAGWCGGYVTEYTYKDKTVKYNTATGKVEITYPIYGDITDICRSLTGTSSYEGINIQLRCLSPDQNICNCEILGQSHGTEFNYSKKFQFELIDLDTTKSADIVKQEVSIILGNVSSQIDQKNKKEKCKNLTGVSAYKSEYNGVVHTQLNCSSYETGKCNCEILGKSSGNEFNYSHRFQFELEYVATHKATNIIQQQLSLLLDNINFQIYQRNKELKEKRIWTAIIIIVLIIGLIFIIFKYHNWKQKQKSLKIDAKKELDSAKKIISKAQKTDSNEYNMLYQTAHKYFIQGNYIEAISMIHKLYGVQKEKDEEERLLEQKRNEKQKQKAEEKKLLEQKRREDKFRKQQKAKGLIEHKGKWLTKKEYHKVREIETDLISNFMNMSGYDFEAFIAELFKRMGYQTHLTPKSQDYGIDVVAKGHGDIIAIQCKRFKEGTNVSNRDIQRARGSMDFYNANKCIIITNQDFTIQAREQARNTKYMELWGRVYLHKLVKKYLIEDYKR